MLKKGTSLPNIWSEEFIPVIPVSQAKDVQELLNETDCICINVDEYPASGQDWVETILLFLGEKYPNDLLVSQKMEELQSANRTALSGSAICRLALKTILLHLSGRKKPVLYIKRPITRFTESDFEHLSHFIGPTIGIVCHTTSENNVPLSFRPKIRYHIMQTMINPNSPVYFSYSRDDSTELVDIICKSLESRDILYSLDMKDVKIQSSIKAYEKAIGNGELVIVVLSDNYFESPDCMYEMAAITNRGEISKRVIFISHFQNVKRKKESHDLILGKWQAEYDKYRNIDPSNVAMTQEMDNIAGIIQTFPDFWKHVVDDVAFSSSEVENDSAASVSDFILNLIAKLKEETSLPMQKILDPINSGNTPGNLTINQTGDHPVIINTINGDVHFCA